MYLIALLSTLAGQTAMLLGGCRPFGADAFALLPSWHLVAESRPTVCKARACLAGAESKGEASCRHVASSTKFAMRHGENEANW